MGRSPNDPARPMDDMHIGPDRAIESATFAAMLAAADLGVLSEAERMTLYAMVDRLYAQIVTLRAVDTTDVEPDIAFAADRTVL